MDAQTETPVEAPAPKKRGRKPRPQAAAASGPTFSDEQFQQLIAVLGAQRSDASGIDPTTLREILSSTQLASAQAMQKAMKPENATHPGISSFSYPKGDVETPRPTLRCEVFWNGHPIHKHTETHHWRELELLNQVEPGEYTVLRKDGSVSPDKVIAKGTYDAKGDLTRLDVTFPVNREERHYIAPMVVMLYQMTHPTQSPKQSYMAGWMDWTRTVLEMEPAVQ